MNTLTSVVNDAIRQAKREGMDFVVVRETKTGTLAVSTPTPSQPRAKGWHVEATIIATPKGVADTDIEVQYAWRGKTRYEIPYLEAKEVCTLIGDFFLNANKWDAAKVYAEAQEAVEERYGIGAVMMSLRTYATKAHRMEAAIERAAESVKGKTDG